MCLCIENSFDECIKFVEFLELHVHFLNSKRKRKSLFQNEIDCEIDSLG